MTANELILWITEPILKIKGMLKMKATAKALLPMQGHAKENDALRHHDQCNDHKCAYYDTDDIGP